MSINKFFRKNNHLYVFSEFYVLKYFFARQLNC